MSVQFIEYLDFKYDEKFEEIMALRESILNENTLPKSTQLYILRNSAETLKFIRAEKKDPLLIKSSQSTFLSASAPNLSPHKYSTTLIIPPSSLIIGGYLKNPKAIKLPSIVMYDAILQSGGEGVKVINNDIILNKKKVCGIETFSFKGGIWFENFVNIEPIELKYQIPRKEYETSKQPGFLTEEIKDFNLDKFIKIIKKDYKDFTDIIE